MKTLKKKLSLVKAAIATWGNSVKRLTLLGLSIMALWSTLSATQYCQQSITAGGKTVLVSLTNPSTNTYVVLIESTDVMTGLYNNIWANNVNGAQAELSGTGVLSNGGKTITMTISSTTVPSFYTTLYVLYPGLISFPWPASITWGTCAVAGIPTLAATTAASSITTTTATSGGNVTDIGTSAVTAKGVCWGTTSGPTVALATKTTDGTGSGSFTSSLTSLSAGTTYYVRAYATNTAGTAYGAEVSFSTTSALPTLAATTAASVITSTTATSGGNVTAIGTSAVTAKGVCWGTTTGPTVALATKTSDGSGTGSFTSSITGLTAGTMYYVRAYATNTSGTAYGAEVSFTTTAAAIAASPTPTASNVLSIYSDAYTPAVTIASWDNWYNCPITAATLADGGNAKKLVVASGGVCGTSSFASPATLDVSGKTHLHIDVYPTTATAIGVCLVQSDASSYISLGTLTLNQWNSKDIALTNYPGKTTAVTQVGFNSTSTGTYYMDNLYFYTPATAPGAPTAAVATRGNASASVAFTAPASNGGSAITGYTVTSSPGNLTATGASSPLNVTGLTNGTSYTFTVTATNAIGTGTASTASTAVTPATVPGAPTAAAATIGNASASVAFTAPASTGGSAIIDYTVTSSPGSFTKTGASSPLVVTGLTNGTAYTFTVTARNAVGSGSASSASSAVTPATIPGAPTIGTITPTDGTLSIAFTAGTTGGSAINNYKYSTNAGSTFTACSPVQTTSPIVITGLTNGTSYNIQIMAVNAIGDGTATVSTAATPSIAAIAPSAPTITGITPSSGQLSVAFTAGSNGGSAITNYKYSSDNGSNFTACSPTQTTSPIVITGLTNGTSYNIQIMAVNAIGEGTATGTTVATPASVPGAPTIGTATAANAQASVTFTAPSGNGGSAVTGYTVTSSPGDFTSSGASSPLVVTGLTNGTAYTFTVTATNSIGTGAASSATGSVTPATIPGAPTIGVITPANGQLSVAFTAGTIGGSAITNYKYSSDNGSTFTACSPEQTTSPVVITGLTNGTPYNVQLKAVNAVGDGTATSSTAATPATTPGAPTIGTATFGNAQASVAFTAPASNGGSAVTSYTVTSSPDGFTASGASSPLVVTGLTNGTAYTFTVSATNSIGTGAASSASNSVTPLSNIPVIAAPTPPVRVAGDVSSIFSDAYTPITGTTVFNPGWGQATTVSNISVAGNTTMKYSTFNFEGTNLGSDLNLTSLGMTHIHLDVWSPDETLIRLSLIQRTPQSERPVNSTITPYTWNSIDIPISDFTSQTSFTVSAIYQLKMEGSGWYPTNTGVRPTVYIDNIYFYKAVPGAPTSVVATAGDAQASVAFTAPGVIGGSAITAYTVTSSPGGLTSTGASSPLVVTGLNNGTAYTFTVKATNTQGTGAASTASNSVTPVPLTVSVSIDANLSSYFPTSATDVTVTAGTLTVDADANVKTMTVAPGAKLTLAAGKTLTVAGALTLQSDASATATYVDNGGTLTAGSTNVDQYLSSDRNWYVSSPVSGAKSDVLSASVAHPVYWYDEVNGTSAPWATITNTTTDLTVMKGYVANFASTGVVTFSGTMNTGAKSIVVSRTAGQTKEGFNLVGNPYPSYLDWDNATKTDLLTSIWYRTKTSGNAYTFDTYNSTGGVSTSNGVKAITNLIPPMQAFWVRVDKTLGAVSGTFAVNNSMRSHADKSSNGFKSKSSTASTQPLICLEVSNGLTTDQAVVYFNANASNSFDSYDSPKMSNEIASIPEIYTLAGTEQVVINGVNNLNQLTLGFTTGQVGNFTIKASQFSNFVSGTQIVLRDNLLNFEQDLTLGDYNFYSDVTANNESRFTVLFKAPSIATGINQNSNGNVWISLNGNNQIVVNGASGETTVAVYNELSQRVVSQRLTSTAKALNTHLANGVYMIMVTNAGKTITRKIIID